VYNFNTPYLSGSEQQKKPREAVFTRQLDHKHQDYQTTFSSGCGLRP